MRAIFTVVCFGLVLVTLSACGDAPKEAVSTQAVSGDPGATANNLTVDLGGAVSMEMVLIPAGSFVMGSDKGEENEKPVHKVTLTKPFYIGKFSVTQEQWQAVMGENPRKSV